MLGLGTHDRPLQIRVVHSSLEAEGQQTLTLAISGPQPVPYLIQRSYEDLLSFARQMKRVVPSLPAVPRRSVRRLSGHVKNDTSQQKPRRILESYFQSTITSAHGKTQAVGLLGQFVNQNQFCPPKKQSEGVIRAKALNQYFTSTGTVLRIALSNPLTTPPNRKCGRAA
jgi:hypothetical protein